jgi:hypothetical protein
VRSKLSFTFAHGWGLALACTIIEDQDGDNGIMNLSFRDEVWLFYSASKSFKLTYQV